MSVIEYATVRRMESQRCPTTVCRKLEGACRGPSPCRPRDGLSASAVRCCIASGHARPSQVPTRQWANLASKCLGDDKPSKVSDSQCAGRMPAFLRGILGREKTVPHPRHRAPAGWQCSPGPTRHEDPGLRETRGHVTPKNACNDHVISKTRLNPQNCTTCPALLRNFPQTNSEGVGTPGSLKYPCACTTHPACPYSSHPDPSSAACPFALCRTAGNTP